MDRSTQFLSIPRGQILNDLHNLYLYWVCTDLDLCPQPFLLYIIICIATLPIAQEASDCTLLRHIPLIWTCVSLCVFRCTWYGWRDYHSVKILNPKGNYSIRELNWVSSEARSAIISLQVLWPLPHPCLYFNAKWSILCSWCVCLWGRACECVRVCVRVCVCVSVCASMCVLCLLGQSKWRCWWHHTTYEQVDMRLTHAIQYNISPGRMLFIDNKACIISLDVFHSFTITKH